MSQVQLNASSIGGVLQTQFSGNVAVPANGLITVDTRDAPALLSRGASYVNVITRWTSIGAARAGSAGRVVASTSLGNGTLSIANQPDFPRQLAVRADPGTLAISAGNVALTYVGNDGVTRTDNISLITGASTIVSTLTSRGVMTLTSAVVTALAGGASPAIQINDTNSLGLAVDAGFVGFSVIKEVDDATNVTIGTVASTAASIVPSTTPNGTHTYGFGYSYTMPVG